MDSSTSGHLTFEAVARREIFLEVVISLSVRGLIPEEDKLIGGASIHISNPGNREGWIGYCLNKQFWGQGIGTEAARALLTFGFSKLGLHRIFATVDPANIASSNILQKIGMLHEGHFRDHKFVRGKWRDTDFYAVIESDVIE